ncbi:MAG: SapC family protein [Gammaproteobacteria bacterium]|nr:SapC family protein [Gammaproteobacteria bacterium]MBU1482948.1 SapC family protein [Gammaproteobacteria bacterium]
MPVMQIYERPVALDRNLHQEIRIADDRNFSFARSCQSAILAAIEMSQAIKEFPVVFIKENDSYLPAAIFGLQQSQNLFVDEAGEWTARYTPAFIRRYPFVPALGQKEDDPMTVFIDEASAWFNRDKGQPLFIDGKNSPLLDSAIQLLEDYKTQMDGTLALVKQLADAGLFSEKTAGFKLDDGQSFSLGGFFTLDTEKLAKLPAQTIYNLLQSGALHIAYLHLSSLDNWNRLIELQAKRSTGNDKEGASKQALEQA